MTKSWTEFWIDTEEGARGLLALGLTPGDQIAVIGPTSYRWVVLDLAALRVGMCTVGLHASSPSGELNSLLAHAGCRAAFVESTSLAANLAETAPDVVRVVVTWGGERSDRSDRLRSWGDVLVRAAGIRTEEVEAAARTVSPGTRAAIVYTSGTTGTPKGAVLTHDNLAFTSQAAAACIATGPGDETLLFLPLAHVFARLCVYFCILRGVVTTFVPSPDRFLEEARRSRPRWFVAVPGLFERIAAGARTRLEASPRWRRGLAAWAFRVGRERTERILSKRPLGALLSLRWALADRLLLHRLRDLFGGNLRFCISGSAPLDPELGRFFHDAGVIVLEGIGMTENTSLSNVNRLDDYRFGSVGPPVPGVEQRVAADGEVFFRGRNVMAGYWQDPDGTAAAVDAAGWLATGDVGAIDADGCLRILDRKKDLIITSGGRNVAPAPLEQLLQRCPGVAHAAVFGDRHSRLVALLALDPERTVVSADGSPPEAVASEIGRAVGRLNEGQPPYRRVHRFAFIPLPTEEGGLLTATAKARRARLGERYRDLLEGLWNGGGWVPIVPPDG